MRVFDKRHRNQGIWRMWFKLYLLGSIGAAAAGHALSIVWPLAGDHSLQSSVDDACKGVERDRK